MNTHIYNNARYAFVTALILAVLGVISYFAFEPTLGQAISDEFVVSQEITNEISWNATSTDVTMVGTIAGLTGGYATGTATQSINTNNSTGYNMTLQFADDGGGNAMGNGTVQINNYTPASAGTADHAWVDPTTGNPAEFGYTVNASTSGEIAQRFMYTGSTCGTGSTEGDDNCWFSPTTTVADTIIDTSAANGNSTSTIKFKVAVPNAPSPALPSGFYTATATLTAVTNP